MSQKHVKHISCESRCKFGRKYNSKQKWNNDTCQYYFQKGIKHCLCREDYAWNSSMCAFKFQ